ncbi:hypothetical protein [Nonomuraea sp. NPDC050643]|uniref:hypothetical protein n=1 Tax=Nonomuraea sp. NPDC050643 TaxID=3155660 RepID=UPI0033D99A23
MLAELAAPPWLHRVYLERIEGVHAPWGAPPVVLGRTLTSPAQAADAVVRLEWARQEGLLDGAAVLRCPLDEETYLEVEVRAGHVVRARRSTP